MSAKKKLGELLVEQGATNPGEVDAALSAQKAGGAGKKVGELLVSAKKVTDDHVARALAAQFQMPFVKLPEVPEKIGKLVPIDYQAENKLVPFKLDGEGAAQTLCIAVADPAELQAVDDLRFQLRKPVRIFVAAASDVEAAIAGQRGEKLEELEVAMIEEDEGTPPRATAAPATAPSKPAPAAPAAEELPTEWADSFGPPEPAATPAAAPAPPPKPPASAAPPPPPPAATGARPPPPPPPLPGGAAKAGSSVTPPPAAAKPGIGLVKFGGAASKGTEGKVIVTESPTPPSFSEEDLAILDSLEKMAQGEEPVLQTDKVKPTQMVASLIRLLIKKRVIGETEFLEELSRK